jgi:hypothetical protein
MLVVDAGDCFFASPTKKAPTKAEEIQETRKARTILNACNLMGYQALGVGPADLQMGMETLLDLQKEARFPFLCANIVEKATGKPAFKPYVVVTLAGIRLGIYSVMLADLNETYKARVLPNHELKDPEQVTREVVAELRKSCDIVVALSQLNVDANEKIIDAKLGIDVLVDPLSKNGTKAIWVDETGYCTVRNGTPILRVDGQGSRLGVFEMYFAKGSGKMAAYRGYDAPLEPHILRHPEMTRLVQEFSQGRKDPWAIDFDVSKPRLLDDFLGAEGCGGCHQEQLDFWKGTAHSRTFSTLAKSGDSTRPECFICHTTGYGVTFAEIKEIDKYKEVQCEACHGFKGGHAEKPASVRLGTVSDENCWGCHNPALTHKSSFDASQVRDKVACPKMKR